MQKNFAGFNSEEVAPGTQLKNDDPVTRWNKDSACISGIFSQMNNDDCGLIKENVGIHYVKKYHEIEIYPNYVKIKGPGPFDPPCSGGSRGKIIEFSAKARNRMIQRMASLVDYPDFWQDFTFPDCVLTGKSIQERAEFSSKVLKRFKRRIETFHQGSWGIWRREWEPRRSGQLKGEKCPHFHMLITIPGAQRECYERTCIIMGAIWVGCINDEEKLDSDWFQKAIKVSTHRKSYRWLENQKMAQVYVSKYLAKEAERGEESQGRFWGKIGDPPIGAPVKVRMTKPEARLMRRLFRRKVGKSAGRVHSILKNQIASGWLLVAFGTVKKMMIWVKDTLEEEVLEGFSTLSAN